MTEPMLLLDLVIRIAVAIILGAAIGLERQWRLRTAGIRTNALVAGGSALFVIVGAVGLVDGGATADPTRVAAQVVSGIGFLGAGVILRDGANIRGLTTAATLWCAAAIGTLAGAGMEEVALIGAAAIVGTNTLLRPLSAMINRRMANRESLAPTSTDVDSDEEEDLPSEYVLEIVTADKNEPRVRALVLQTVAVPGYTLRSLDIRSGKNALTTLLAGVSTQGNDASGLESAVHRITLDPKVRSGRWWPVDSED